MGKRIIQQARGHGSHTYRVRRKAFSVKAQYPRKISGEFVVVKLIASAGHSAPIAKLKNLEHNNKEQVIFFNVAAKNLYEGQKIQINGHENGDISMIGDLKNGTKVFNIENAPGDGGKLIKTGGNSGIIVTKTGDLVSVLMPSKKEKKFDVRCRATMGEAAGQGRLEKPILKAGKQYFIKKAKSKLWPRTSALKMNAIDHPFGSGRGKNPKSKIAQRFASPGQKVGLIRPRRTGRKKR